MMKSQNQNNRPRNHRSKNYKKRDHQREKEENPQGYRFRRVLGEILRYMNTIPNEDGFTKCQKDFESQLSELITRGFTWGMAYPIPVHESDFKQLQRKEWAAIRAIVRKQQFSSSSGYSSG